MIPLILFAVLALAGQAINVVIGIALEQVMPQTATLFVFLFLFAGMFAVAWKATLWLVDHGPLSALTHDRGRSAGHQA